MKHSIVRLAAALALLAAAFQSSAQVIPVGGCQEPGKSPVNIERVQQAGPFGMVSYLRGWQQQTQAVPGPYGPVLQTTNVAVPLGPDPSGLNFLVIQSGVPNVQFRVAWNGAFIAFNSYTGLGGAIGQCNLNVAAMAHYMPPPPVMPTVFFNFESTFQAEQPPIPSPAMVEIPQGFYALGEYTPPAVIATRAMASVCLNEGADADAFYKCVIARAVPDEQRKYFDCAAQFSTTEEASLCMLGSQMGQAEKKQFDLARQCYGSHGTDWSQYPVCMASGQVGGDVAKAMRCLREGATQGDSINYFSLATCTFGDSLLGKLNPNPESAIAIRCAAESGGNPKFFVACTAGKLAYRELDKCLTGGFGTDDGCFGPNNSLERAYSQITDEIDRAFGKNSVVADAWRAATLTATPAQAARTFKDVQREARKLGSNISAETGRALDKIGEAAKDVAPRITIAPIKVKVGPIKIRF